jgi:hypothetical protein
MRSSSWREALHRLGSNAVTVFGDWSAASGWHKTFELLHHASADQRHRGG